MGKLVLRIVDYVIDIGYIVNSMVAQAPLVAIAVLVLYYKIVEVRRELATLGKRVERIEEEVGANKAELSEVRTNMAEIRTRLAAMEGG
jgi:cell division protein FtsL